MRVKPWPVHQGFDVFKGGKGWHPCGMQLMRHFNSKQATTAHVPKTPAQLYLRSM